MRRYPTMCDAGSDDLLPPEVLATRTRGIPAVSELPICRTCCRVVQTVTRVVRTDDHGQRQIIGVCEDCVQSGQFVGVVA